MRAYERLLNYVKVYTTSEDEQENVPSTSRQFDLGNQLAEELKKIGVQDVRIDDKCYVYGVIPATEGLEEKPAIGFIAHMDTAPDFSGENVNPQIIPEYDGGDVKLGDSEYALTLKDFPHLASLKGRTLITTDGSTLLGADDKAGVAEIMTMAGLSTQSKGVDSSESSLNSLDAAKALSQRVGCIVCVSGETDLVVEGDRVVYLHNGSPMMKKVTGLGCTASAILGAFAAVVKNPFMAAVSATSFMGVCGEIAVGMSQGPGTLQLHLYDVMYNLSQEQFMQIVRVSE